MANNDYILSYDDTVTVYYYKKQNIPQEINLYLYTKCIQFKTCIKFLDVLNQQLRWGDKYRTTLSACAPNRGVVLREVQTCWQIIYHVLGVQIWPLIVSLENTLRKMDINNLFTYLSIILTFNWPKGRPEYIITIIQIT